MPKGSYGKKMKPVRVLGTCGWHHLHLRATGFKVSRMSQPTRLRRHVHTENNKNGRLLYTVRGREFDKIKTHLLSMTMDRAFAQSPAAAIAHSATPSTQKTWKWMVARSESSNSTQPSSSAVVSFASEDMVTASMSS